MRASRWFESRGDLHEAMEQASQVDDKDRLLELLDRYGLALISRSELAGIRRWLGEIDPTVVRPFPLAWCTDA